MGRDLIRARTGWQEPATFALAALVVCMAVLPPLVEVARELVGSTDALALLASAPLWLLLGRSLALAVVVTALALLFGVPLGVLFARADVPFGRALFSAHVAVALLPPFLPALGWFALLGREGLVGGETSTRLLFGPLGVALVLTTCLTPVVTALTALGVRGVAPSLEEAARVVAGPLRAAALVLVPCAAPAIALGAVVVFALAFAELGVPMFLRVDVYPAVVFARLGGMDFAPGEAAVFVLPMAAVAIVLLVLERRFAGRRALGVLGARAAVHEPLFARHPLTLALAVLAAAASVLPLVALALQAAHGARLDEVVVWIGASAFNGLRASVVAAGVMTAVALVLGRALARRARGASWLDGLAALAFLLPSSILGIGIIGAWNRPSTSWLYGGFGILVVGFVARYGVVATRAFAAVVEQVPRSYEEAARAAGARFWRRLWLLAGLSRPGLIATFVLALVFSLRDLETAALFYPPGGEPLTVRIFTLEANGPPGVVAALALVHVAVTFAVAALAVAALSAVAPGRRGTA